VNQLLAAIWLPVDSELVVSEVHGFNLSAGDFAEPQRLTTRYHDDQP
jgi:hypothetical protein